MSPNLSKEITISTERHPLLAGDAERCCGLTVCKRVLPSGFVGEFKEQVKIAWPIAVAQLLQFLILVVSLAFCGRLGKETLDGVALATTLINVTGNSVVMGLSSACDTLFTQTFGSKNRHYLGIILQRSLIILGIGCIPCVAILLNTEVILLLMGQNPEVSKLAGFYTTVYIAAMPGYLLFVAFSKYLQAQSIVYPTMFIGILTNLINAGLHAFFIFVLELGITGASISVTLCQWILFLLHVVFIWKTGIYKGTWSGWSVECLYSWGTFVSLGLPGLFMVCCEWWGYEILMFVVGGVVDLTTFAAHVIIYNLAAIISMLPIGLSVSACVRVGNMLGSCQPRKAFTASKVALCIEAIVAAFSAIVLLVMKDFIPQAFSDDLDVVEAASKVMPQLSLFVICDGVQMTCNGIIRGIGLQKFGALTNCVVYYMVAVPAALVLLLFTDLGISGVWWGMNLGPFGAATVYIVRITFTNWNEETEKAQQRIEKGHNFEQGTVFTEEINEASISLIKKNDTKYEDPQHTKPNFKKIIMSRVLICGSMLLLLCASIALRVLYTYSPLDTDCVFINSVHVNKSAIESNISQLNVTSGRDSFVMNMTYWIESTKGWNTSFLLCNDDEILFTTNDNSWPEYSSWWSNVA